MFTRLSGRGTPALLVSVFLSLFAGEVCAQEDACADCKPRVLTFLYTGADCSATTHSQDPSKVNCSGDPAAGTPVRILATDDADPNDTGAKVWFDGTVYLGMVFRLDANAAGADHFASATFVHILDMSGNPLQELEFHTSCSQALFTGDQFGSVLLVDSVGECEGPPGDCCENGNPRVLSMTYTGESCDATFHYQDPSKVNCSGDPAFAASVHILATDDEDPNDSGARIFFDGDVALGGTFYIDAANAGESKLRSKTFVHISDLAGNPLQEIEFHTSCSQPLTAGNRFGSLQLIGCCGADEVCEPDVFCVADENDCPCGNDVAGAGCRNSTGAGGRLTALGSHSVTTDDLMIVASDLPLNQFGVVFMGPDVTRVTFGNGLICVSAGTLKILRYPVKPINANGKLSVGPGIVQFAADNFADPIGQIQAGAKWNFQTWYRDPGGPCGGGFNFTNAVAVTFTP